MTDDEAAEIVARLGNLYVRRGLSPPFNLYKAVRHWSGLSQDEIVEVVEKHFADHRVRYSGSGDGYFWMVEAAIRKAMELKHPPIDHVEPARPQRRRGVRKVYTAGGYEDVIYEDAEPDA
jgi:hypothetical protein